MSFRPPILYPVTDRHLGEGSHDEQVARLLAGGARIVQVRDKSADDRQFLRQLDASVACARRNHALLVVNDRADLARLSGAGGVHLGEEDLPLEEARRQLGPTVVLGRSSHDPESARAAERAGADYVAIGPIFATSSKPDAGPAVGLEGLRAARAAVGIPVVAIGGITLARAPEVLGAGADSLAIVRDLVGADDVTARVASWMRLRPEPRRGLLFLTGFMGTGKSSVGREVAMRLGRRFVDLDLAVQSREGASIEEIFRARGESGFRAAEAALLGRIPAGGDADVALGGGTLLAPGALERLRALGHLVWLDCPLDEARRRLGDPAGRPLLRAESSLQELLRQRLPGYRQAHRRVSVAARTVAEVAGEIALWFDR